MNDKRRRAEECINVLVEHGVLNVIRDGVSIQDTDYKILYQNDFHKGLVGDHKGDYCFRAYDKSEQHCESCPLKAAFHDGQVCTSERKVNVESGEKLFKITASPIKDTDGSIIAGIEIVRDITEESKRENVLRVVAERVSSEVGEAFFTSLAKFLAESLGTDYAFVGKLSKDNDNAVKTIAVCAHGDIIDNFEYGLEDTPCHKVIGRDVCIYPSGVQGEFPKDELLIKMGVESYMGVPLFASDGRALGIIVIMDGKPFSDDKHAEAILRIFAARASSEIERKLIDDKLLREKDLSESMINSLPGIFYLITEEGRFIRWNKNFELVTGYSSGEIAGMSPLDFFEGDDIELIKSRIHDVFEKGESSAEAGLVSKGRERAPFFFTGLRIVVDDKPQLIGVGLDISERKKIENDLISKEAALEERVSDLEQFYNMAIGREVKMKELKERLLDLEEELSRYKR